jgi:hypothetical protein
LVDDESYGYNENEPKKFTVEGGTICACSTGGQPAREVGCAPSEGSTKTGEDGEQ